MTAREIAERELMKLRPSTREKVLRLVYALGEAMPKTIGKIQPEHTLYLKMHGCDATDGKRKYHCGAEARSMMPIIVSEQTGKTFIVPWEELIRLARAAGIDKP